MGSGFCLKTIIGLKRAKRRKSKQVKGANGSDEPKVELSSSKDFSSTHYSNGTSSKKIACKAKLTENVAATRIQAAFRAHLARKALRRVRGVVRFQGVIEGLSVNNQIAGTLRQIHCWSKIQSEIRARRLSMVTQGRNKQKKIQNQQKLDAKLHELEVEWDSGAETMEEILHKLHQREEAATKRERAMAYAFSHQWRANSNQYFGQAYYDLGKDSWGWSWMERWIAIRPWETRVHTNPKISLSHQVAKIAKTTNLGPMKLVVSFKNPVNTNGKDSLKGKKLSISVHENQTSQEADM